jgi:hypothetical protein
MNHYLNVFLQDNMSQAQGDQVDLYWLQRAGMEAAALAGKRGQHEQAIQLYRRLKEMLPQLNGFLEQRIQQQEERAGTGGE